jgi:hypothetical protein
LKVTGQNKYENIAGSDDLACSWAVKEMFVTAQPA